MVILLPPPPASSSSAHLTHPLSLPPAPPPAPPPQQQSNDNRGSAQLIGHPLLRPKSIHSADALEAFEADYTYLGCVAFVKRVKKGPLFETSPMLDDVSGVPAWQKVNQGMLKMYQAEVLGKLPVMQHFLFGSLLKWQG